MVLNCSVAHTPMSKTHAKTLALWTSPSVEPAHSRVPALQRTVPHTDTHAPSWTEPRPVAAVTEKDSITLGTVVLGPGALMLHHYFFIWKNSSTRYRKTAHPVLWEDGEESSTPATLPNKYRPNGLFWKNWKDDILACKWVGTLPHCLPLSGDVVEFHAIYDRRRWLLP